MMSLNSYSQPQKREVSLKAALRRMRSLWDLGPVNRFDLKLSLVLDCSIGKASEVREIWENLGFLCYDKRGLLTWRNRGF